MTNTMKRLAVLLVGMLFVLCTAMALVVGMPASTAFAASTTSYSIGDTVEFAGYEWYVIGTETEGVTAPSGCYTLFAKNDDFGSSVFGDYRYQNSTLCQEVGKIADSFSSYVKVNIVARETLDGISGNSPTNQYLWPLSVDELNSLNDNIKEFTVDYYTRYAETFGDYVAAYGYYVSSNLVQAFSGRESSMAIRPALYVKASFLKEPNGHINRVLGKRFLRKDQK